MHKIYYYKTAQGEAPVTQYLSQLASRGDKDSRVKLNKIRDYIKALSVYGTAIGQPQVKHLEGEIWELRPLRDRIFFVAWVDGGFVLLHHFMKQSQKHRDEKLKKPSASWRT